mmetsp:Transcript_44902/g.73153  ORF Transcript_44902/g.73153 Transcript_44902/m.73153 type:complete len:231 (+) Transcript_44902:72-764(+)|eukprot:CAMPEP_0184675666 /NCGR_PEP_ID=MMETSP0308-20130426/87915_1 /TAXON_ID=38269 /ORGANISM="Gloeochaete witrockiana, Strain SAG 46.84" /LENGTH=230 /DNA_ID=CAMNT_0027123395 /DNA_START=69 /DNA_END=761 /DNA_ORIENTATION=+
METSEELKVKILEYKEQLVTVEQALEQAPDNDALQKLTADLKELINITEELLSDMQQQKESVATSTQNSSTAAQPIVLLVGSKVMARYREGLHPATVRATFPEGKVLVHFDHYGGNEILEAGDIFPAKPEYSSPAALRKRVAEEMQAVAAASVSSVSKDDKKRRVKKLKKVEDERSTTQKSWEQFKGKKRIGDKSIFKSPESVSGKVGVTGSGKGMTEHAGTKRERFLPE